MKAYVYQAALLCETCAQAKIADLMADYYKAPSIAPNEPNAKVLAALQVMILTPGIRAHLEAHDPKALEQAEAAIRALVDTGDSDDFPQGPYADGGGEAD